MLVKNYSLIGLADDVQFGKSGGRIIENSENFALRNSTNTSNTNLTLNRVLAGAGTVSSPTLSFSSDDDTGIYSPASNSIAFTQNGNEILRIDGQGNIRVTNGSFASLGDASQLQFVLRAVTTNATVQEMLINGTNRMVLPNNCTWRFAVYVVARRVDATNENAAYSFSGCIYRNTTAASTTLVGSANKLVEAEQTTAWDANVVADVSNGALRVEVLGQTGKTIRWVAFAHVTQVLES